jgi:anti-anti-sigma regulatory factor
MTPFTLTEDRITFHDVFVERTEAYDKTLRAFVTRGVPVTIDLSGVKYVDTPWIRLITMLNIEEGADITIVGADKGTRDIVDYLGHTKYWKHE